MLCGLRCADRREAYLLVFDSIVELFKKDYRYCEYSHCYYCLNCHTNQTSVLPSRIVSRWDFKLYPVACVCRQYLDNIANQPLICIAAVNPQLFESVDLLQKLRNDRLKLSYIYDYVKVCKQCNEVAAMERVKSSCSSGCRRVCT